MHEIERQTDERRRADGRIEFSCVFRLLFEAGGPMQRFT